MPFLSQVGSFAVFVIRHRGLVGGGKEELQHIARIIAINMVCSSPMYKNGINFVIRYEKTMINTW